MGNDGLGSIVLAEWGVGINDEHDPVLSLVRSSQVLHVRQAPSVEECLRSGLQIVHELIDADVLGRAVERARQVRQRQSLSWYQYLGRRRQNEAS